MMVHVVSKEINGPSILSDQLMSFVGILNKKQDLLDARKQIWKEECYCASDILHKSRGISNNQCPLEPDKLPNLDIYMPDLLKEMDLYYPKFTWTHTGWVQDFQIEYGSSDWDVEQILVLPFSHVDPGWRSTYDSCHKKASTILRQTMKQLLADTKLTFAWAEIIFLRRWYLSLNQNMKNDFKRLLASGRFDIVTGGLVMTDESVSTYSPMLDQLIEGHQWLKDEFDYHPKTSWAIDPFGLSSSMPYLLQESGVENLLILRTHYSVKRHLAFRRQLEFHWRQTWDGSNNHSLFTHLTPFLSYNIMYSCGPDMSVCCQYDFSRPHCWRGGKNVNADLVTKDNVAQKSWALLEQWRKKSKLFQHNVVLAMHGDDFRYMTENEWKEQFGNLNQIIDYINSHPELHAKVKYGTLSDYFNEVKKRSSQNKLSFPKLGGDFFPYSDRGQQYWSGFYTTRPLIKYMARFLQHRLRAADILFSLALLRMRSWVINKADESSQHVINDILNAYQSIYDARENSGLILHHDAITGTVKSSVNQDYLSRIHNAVIAMHKVIIMSTRYLLLPEEDLRMEISQNDFKILNEQLYWNSLPIDVPVLIEPGKDKFIVVYNPLAHIRREVVRILVTDPDVYVTDAASSHPVKCQVNPRFEDREIHRLLFELYIEVLLEPLSLTRYVIKPSKDTTKSCEKALVQIQSNIHNHHIDNGPFKVSWERYKDTTLHTDQLAVRFCHCSGLPETVSYKRSLNDYKAEIQFVKYSTGSWTNPFEDKSGAYIFMPSGEAVPMTSNPRVSYVMKGSLVSSVETDLGAVIHKATVYNITGIFGQAVHLENVVNIQKEQNTELAMRLYTDIDQSAQPVFYTDSNGFHMTKRQSLRRLPMQGNFYPLSSEFFIEDMLNRMTLLTGQSHGVANLKPGEVDIMLDRKLEQDDWRGMSEGVTDNVRAHSRFMLIYEQSNRPPDPERSYFHAYSSMQSTLLSQMLDNPVIISQQMRHVEIQSDQWLSMRKPLPCNMQLLNIRTTPLQSDMSGQLDFDKFSYLVLKSKKYFIIRHKKTECIYTHVPDKPPLCDSKGDTELNLRKHFFVTDLPYVVNEMSLTGLSIKHINVTSLKFDPMTIKMLDVIFD